MQGCSRAQQRRCRRDQGRLGRTSNGPWGVEQTAPLTPWLVGPVLEGGFPGLGEFPPLLHQGSRLIGHPLGLVLAQFPIGGTGIDAALTQRFGNGVLHLLQRLGGHRSGGGRERRVQVAGHRDHHAGQAAIEGTAGEGRAAGGLHVAVEDLMPVREELVVGAVAWALGVEQHQHQAGLVAGRV